MQVVSDLIVFMTDTHYFELVTLQSLDPLKKVSFGARISPGIGFVYPCNGELNFSFVYLCIESATK